MATPFSPFVGRLPKTFLKRRQSQVPSDLIDWDAPEIPELEKQRIIYEDYIKELNEDHDVEVLLNEQIFQVAHDAVIETYQMRLKKLEDEMSKERSKVNLMLGQIRMSENNIKVSDERIEELESEVSTQRDAIAKLELEKENLSEERNSLQMEVENLNFRNNEMTCELNHNLEIYLQKKNEADDYRKKFDALKNQLNYYKRLAKNKDRNEDFE